MAIIKCKMCGGDIELSDEKKMTLFTRANRLLRNCEFDKASGVFETIVADFPEEAEAYWGLVLCKYGIEYVDDPATGKKIPTCHRSSFESVLDDPNFEQACENADAIARRVYRDEARQIEELRKGIIEVSGKEEPYDIFISYKETDENGDRTLDSVIAQDIYTELTEKGYRVFFSRISLESKLGTEYEPYIFAALNSAKVMLVVGTDYDNFDAVWVKNEWSRFLKLIASGQKKTLIPVFKNMDAYDMPKEFAKLSAQDMGKVGAMQDLVRGVEKLVPLKKQESVQVEKVMEKVIVQQQSEGSMKTDAAIKRGKLALEDGEWEKAKQYFDQALTLDAECAEAYFGIAMAELRARDPESYIRTATSQTPKTEKLSIPEDSAHIRKTATENAVNGFLKESDITPLYRYDLSYPSTLKGQQEIQAQVRQQIEGNRSLGRALRFASGEEKTRMEGFKKVPGFQDAETRISQCEKAISDIQVAERQERERAARAAATKRKRTTTTALIILVAFAVSAFFVMTRIVIPEMNRKNMRKVGKTVTFGAYEQDNNTSNGKEEIEWIVLANEGNQSLLISRSALDCRQYNTKYTDVTWESCSLRTWLNGTFLKEAFSAEEQKAILTTKVDNSKSQGNSSWSTSGGNNTEDKVFLLSYAEAGKHFSSNSDRICKPTAYAKAQGAYTNDSGNCWWWLRSPGSTQDGAASVSTGGSLGSSDTVGSVNDAVRPAFWLNLESDIF